MHGKYFLFLSEMNITLGMKIEQDEEDRMGWDEMGERRQKRRNKRKEVKRGERRLSSGIVHSKVNIISNLYVVCFYAGL